jgi:hypothetical protein
VILTSHDARTAERGVWEAAVLNPGGRRVYHLVAVESNQDNDSSCLSEDGDDLRDSGGSEYKLVVKNSLDEMCMATPAIAQENLVLRTASTALSHRKCEEIASHGSNLECGDLSPL